MPDTQAFIDAIKAGEYDRVKAMVSADPELIDAHSRTGDSAILTAVYHRQKEIVNLLVARGVSLTLFEACAAGELERVERLLADNPAAINQHSADVNAPDAAGWRPLHLAAFNNNLDAMKALIAQGADVSAVNGDGQTPLSLAQEKNQREAAALLRRYGA